jgi:hypothetical protein
MMWQWIGPSEALKRPEGASRASGNAPRRAFEALQPRGSGMARLAVRNGGDIGASRRSCGRLSSHRRLHR